ncbi:patatin-like phospholipase family protein [Lichenihabitans sp. Uapishka_5]|uniref:patatin-like phospholipase family protein n=1 Tax=Lichenihabitans sp. Uapishka_5 TaxID=3037302 RepID=UPI0029E7D22F|nr:patatin-like phospholipase family protein [Lichenihabitans sp. Uapishka_5]MDX7950380.1 patatin-like phospholipase family protein [Lichenihabitans sp. Uapishka_5]
MAQAKTFPILVVALLGTALSACSTTAERIPYTPAEAAKAEVPNMGNIRFSGDAPAAVFDRFRQQVVQQATARHESVSYLALSGGGGNGAFGAGFLRGLSEAGHRPNFTIVSGVSTGALMAPFVFLGPDYDATLQDLYTSGFASTLVKDVNVLNGLFGNSLVDSDKLGRLIARYIDDGILQKVAAEHRRGRRLLIVTTNLDAQRSEIWDMGAIASSGAPNALALFRQVMAASASVPGLFPPRRIEVTASGQSFQELHVDGGTLRQIYVAPDETIYGESGKNGSTGIKDLYILVNNKVDPTFDVVPDATLQVGARSLATILKREGRNNVMSAYAYAKRNGIGYHVAYIDAAIPDLPPSRAEEEFGKTYMSYVYDMGKQRGREAQPWSATPPLTHSPVLSPDAPSGSSPPESAATTLAKTAATGG